MVACRGEGTAKCGTSAEGWREMVPRNYPMSTVRSALLLCGLVVAVALTVAWDSFLSTSFSDFAEFMF